MTRDLAQTLAGAAARARGPQFYLDANILVDIAQPDRYRASLDFIGECLGRSWKCVTSTFAVMEALDVLQENRWASIQMRKGESFDQLVRKRPQRALRPPILKEVHRRLIERLDKRVVEPFHPGPSVWENAILLAINTASFAPDCIHVAAARSRRCDVLITRDSQLRRTASGEILVADPAEVLARISSEPGQVRT